MFIFFFFTRNIDVKVRDMLEEVTLDEIPCVKIETKFPGYYDWYAEKRDESLVIYRRSSELFSGIRSGKGMTDYEYYNLYYALKGKTKSEKLIKREYTYEFVKRYCNHRTDLIEINISYIDIKYELDDSYKNVSNWGELRWEKKQQIIM
ncbi:hypothetical protein [Clostridium butyricum]|uniref:Uncharacterized protein n=1 Tax=Clostridium butyricum E4 str. BoNT E BL5262 TaxID=632245 RepID=C4IFB7_CLOBU|nr:hypothetical protein [Clostridium butyricum]EDT77029.1 hypothetical protein CBY_0598 [Clostridium butyricum 5521]EEP53435.1 hypothetical protein CLP_1621 [Clostridium butyricum E4 str. BoNT E BL5262]NFL32980.1 hypothetical protein [Clostridium butyricum]NFS17949.1 hypothetical protein [Clostridium butyricum]